MGRRCDFKLFRGKFLLSATDWENVQQTMSVGKEKPGHLA